MAKINYNKFTKITFQFGRWNIVPIDNTWYVNGHKDFEFGPYWVCRELGFPVCLAAEHGATIEEILLEGRQDFDMVLGACIVNEKGETVQELSHHKFDIRDEDIENVSIFIDYEDDYAGWISIYKKDGSKLWGKLYPYAETFCNYMKERGVEVSVSYGY